MLILIGLAIGVVGALALTRVLRSLLFDVTATDPVTFVAVSLLLMAVGVSMEILLGNKGHLFGGVATALIGLVATLGANGLVGLIALGVIAFLIRKRKVTRTENPQ